MAQSQTAVLSRPTIANVSKRLAGYLPLSSTCPSLPHVQIGPGTQPHTLSDCVVQSCMQDGHLVEDWTLIVTPGPCTLSPTTDKDKQAQTTHRPVKPARADEQAPDQDDQETPRAGAVVGAVAGAGAGAVADAGVMSFETLIPSRRFGDDDSAVNNRRSTPPGVDETTVRMPNATRSTEFGAMSTYRKSGSGAVKMQDGRSNNRDATSMSFTRSHESDSSCVAAARLPNGKPIEAVAGPRNSLNPPRISNTIEHFEALISGDGSDGKFKTSIRLPKRLTGSSSCHLSKPEGKPKMGAAESARRKFSNSWGPARFRKSRVPCGSGERRPKQSDEPAYKRGNDQVPTDGTVKNSPPAPEHWLARFQPNINSSSSSSNNNNNNKKINTSHVAQVQASRTRSTTSGRLRPKGPRPQPTTTTTIAGTGRTSRSAEQPATGTEMHGHANDGHVHGSWRSRRRWMSRSSTPLVAQADCALQQPKPIRVNEVRRLVSLCRDKMTARKYRAQTD
ncbi:hypothetical protein E4U43_004136 [Claviceps pusilla]|uniref:Uncharacterized protein n=1 Tax=Claviceps pusilla TaxID=123648 RepID=A0A9P7SWB6_9HYPO|nr:hypothetical protein E4U43_004136 [Claviceps pusilla]